MPWLTYLSTSKGISMPCSYASFTNLRFNSRTVIPLDTMESITDLKYCSNTSHNHQWLATTATASYLCLIDTQQRQLDSKFPWQQGPSQAYNHLRLIGNTLQGILKPEHFILLVVRIHPIDLRGQDRRQGDRCVYVCMSSKG